MGACKHRNWSKVVSYIMLSHDWLGQLHRPAPAACKKGVFKMITTPGTPGDPQVASSWDRRPRTHSRAGSGPKRWRSSARSRCCLLVRQSRGHSTFCQSLHSLGLACFLIHEAIPAAHSYHQLRKDCCFSACKCTASLPVALSFRLSAWGGPHSAPAPAARAGSGATHLENASETSHALY